MVHVPIGAEGGLSFVRRDARSKVFAVCNPPAKPRGLRFEQALYHGTFTDYFAGKPATLDGKTVLKLAPWDYRVYVQSPRDD